MYSANNPVNAVDLDGKQPNGLETMLKYGFQDVNTAKIENDLEQSIKEIPQNSIDGVIKATDYVSDASTVGVVVGGLSVVGGIYSKNPTIVENGFKLMKLSGDIGFGSDMTNLISKSINLNYNGSKEEVSNQAVKVLTNYTLRRTAEFSSSKFVKTNSIGRFYNPSNGQFVPNKYGNIIKASSVAIPDALAIPIDYQLNKKNK